MSRKQKRTPAGNDIVIVGSNDAPLLQLALDEEVLTKSIEDHISLKKTLQIIGEHKCKNLKIGKLNISTMSIVAMLNTVKFSYAMILARLTDDKSGKRLREDIQRALPRGVTFSVATKTTFSNAAIMKYKFPDYKNTFAVKIFGNGKLHLTGPRDMEEMRDVIEALCLTLNIIFKDVCTGDNRIAMDDYHTQMINTNFSINARVDKQSVINTFLDLNILATIPANHPAVRVDINVPGRSTRDKTQTVTVFIFSSGQVCAHAYPAVTEQLFSRHAPNAQVQACYLI